MPRKSEATSCSCSVAENERRFAALAAKEAHDLKAQLLRPKSGRPRSAAVRCAYRLSRGLSNSQGRVSIRRFLICLAACADGAGSSVPGLLHRVASSGDSRKPNVAHNELSNRSAGSACLQKESPDELCGHKQLHHSLSG